MKNQNDQNDQNDQNQISTSTHEKVKHYLANSAWLETDRDLPKELREECALLRDKLRLAEWKQDKSETERALEDLRKTWRYCVARPWEGDTL